MQNSYKTQDDFYVAFQGNVFGAEKPRMAFRLPRAKLCCPVGALKLQAMLSAAYLSAYGVYPRPLLNATRYKLLRGPSS